MVQFYSELLHETEEGRGQDIEEITRHITKSVTQDHNIMLMQTIDPIEMEEVIFQMEKGKAMGPDGFTIDFF